MSIRARDRTARPVKYAMLKTAKRSRGADEYTYPYTDHIFVRRQRCFDLFPYCRTTGEVFGNREQRPGNFFDKRRYNCRDCYRD